LSGATELAEDVGTVPSGPQRLSAREWLNVFKRTFKQFLADDCMGLSQQVAFSSLLAFFPAMILLVGFLGLIDAYDELKEFLGTVAPGAHPTRARRRRRSYSVYSALCGRRRAR
jgi:membrane protein